MNSIRERHKDARQLKRDNLDHGQSLPEVATTYHSTGSCSSPGLGGGNESGSVSTSD